LIVEWNSRYYLTVEELPNPTAPPKSLDAVAAADRQPVVTRKMELTITICLLRVFPRRYGWSATDSDGNQYKHSSEFFGSSALAGVNAEQAFKNPAIRWDSSFDPPEELGKPVHRGHVFVAAEESG
jgi:hypothetical protein